MRIHYGPGYRLYFTREGRELVILLCGGDKNSQERDIRQAKEIGPSVEMKNAETYTKWDVTGRLRTKDDVCMYLEACAEEDPGDGSSDSRCPERRRASAEHEPAS